MTMPEPKIVCKVCGRGQAGETGFCNWCGAKLVALTDKSGRAPMDPSAGRNKEGIGIILFLLNLITYNYYSHYWGVVAMAFSSLIWVWGRSENWSKNRVRPTDSPEIVTAKRILRIKLTQQGTGFILFLAGAFIFYKYHRIVGSLVSAIGILIGYYDFWNNILHRAGRK